MKIISLNLENGRHINRHMEVLKKEQADVYCFQEVVEPHLADYKKELGCRFEIFIPIAIKQAPFVENVPENTPTNWGVAILSRTPLELKGVHHFAGLNDEELPDSHENSQGDIDEKTFNWSFPVVEVEVAGETYVVATTHFPKAPLSNITTEYQLECFGRVVSLLEKYPDIILAGDFNAPRGMQIYDTLAEKYKAVVPASVKSTVDLDLHRNGHKDPAGLSVVVDGIFHTSGYQIASFKTISGVSDHLALVCDIFKQ